MEIMEAGMNPRVEVQETGFWKGNNISSGKNRGGKELKLLCFLRRKQNILYLCTRFYEVK